MDNRSHSGLAAYACTRCSTRKIKCEKQLPQCEKCVAAKAECVYLTPAPPKRRKRKLSDPSSSVGSREDESVSEFRSIDGVSESAGYPVLESVHSKHPRANERISRQNRDGVKSANASLNSTSEIERPFGENELWSRLTEVQPSVQVQTSADTDIWYSFKGAIDGEGKASQFDPIWDSRPLVDLEAYWPSPATASKLWQAYKDNFKPLVKIVHGPSVEKLVYRKSPPYFECSPAEQALLCAIFATAVYSMSEEDCQTQFNEDRAALLQRHRSATRYALFTADFLVSRDLTVIQAFVMFLMSLRYDYDSSPLWTLSGIAVRNGKRIGLDRLHDITPYSPFEREVRTWVWFNLLYFDAWLAEVAGSRQPWAEFREPFKSPRNINDEDMDPAMTEAPKEREGATDVMFTLLRCDWVKARQRMMNSRAPGGIMDDGTIDELEDNFSRKYLRHCDPTIPMHFLLLLTVKTMIANLRLSAHRPRLGGTAGASTTAEASQQEDADRLFQIGLKALEYESMAQSTHSLQVFRWHFQHDMPRTAMIFVLSELRKRTSGKDVEKAWVLIEDVFTTHPELVNESHRQLFWAIGSLALDAWERREASCQQRGVDLSRPKFISQLRAQRTRRSSRAFLPGSSHNDETAAFIKSQQAYKPRQPTEAALLNQDLPLLGPGVDTISPTIDAAFDDPFDSGLAATLDWTQWDILMGEFAWQAPDGPNETSNLSAQVTMGRYV